MAWPINRLANHFEMADGRIIRDSLPRPKEERPVKAAKRRAETAPMVEPGDLSGRSRWEALRQRIRAKEELSQTPG